MSFLDVPAPADMPNWPLSSTPKWSSRITVDEAGAEHASARWAHPLRRFTMPEVARTQATYEAVAAQWLVMRGPRHTWPFRDPTDFTSSPMQAPNDASTITAMDQRIGTGDGVTTEFQLLKNYARDDLMYQRRILLPVLGSVSIWKAGVLVDPDDFSVSRPGGVVTFDTAPPFGQVIRAGYRFECEVRFESDDAFEGIVRSWAASGYAAITLLEAREC